MEKEWNGPEAHGFLQSYLGLLQQCGQELERLFATDDRSDSRQEPEPVLESAG